MRVIDSPIPDQTLCLPTDVEFTGVGTALTAHYYDGSTEEYDSLESLGDVFGVCFNVYAVRGSDPCDPCDYLIPNSSGEEREGFELRVD